MTLKELKMQLTAKGCTNVKSVKLSKSVKEVTYLDSKGGSRSLLIRTFQSHKGIGVYALQTVVNTNKPLEGLY